MKLLKLVLVILIFYYCSSCSKGSDVGDLFFERCSGCHGTDGHPIKEDVPNCTTSDFQTSHTDDQLVDSITNGKLPRMPSYKDKLTDTQIRSLASYIRKFGKTKS